MPTPYPNLKNTPEARLSGLWGIFTLDGAALRLLPRFARDGCTPSNCLFSTGGIAQRQPFRTDAVLPFLIAKPQAGGAVATATGASGPGGLGVADPAAWEPPAGGGAVAPSGHEVPRSGA